MVNVNMNLKKLFDIFVIVSVVMVDIYYLILINLLIDIMNLCLVDRFIQNKIINCLDIY